MNLLIGATDSGATTAAWVAVLGVMFTAACSAGAAVLVAVLNRRTNTLRQENSDQHGQNLAVAQENQRLLVHLASQSSTHATLLAEMQAAFIGHIAADADTDDAILTRLASLETSIEDCLRKPDPPAPRTPRKKAT